MASFLRLRAPGPLSCSLNNHRTPGYGGCSRDRLQSRRHLWSLPQAPGTLWEKGIPRQVYLRVMHLGTPRPVLPLSRGRPRGPSRVSTSTSGRQRLVAEPSQQGWGCGGQCGERLTGSGCVATILSTTNVSLRSWGRGQAEALFYEGGWLPFPCEASVTVALLAKLKPPWEAHPCDLDPPPPRPHLQTPSRGR